jgi:hypothetical protein
MIVSALSSISSCTVEIISDGNRLAISPAPILCGQYEQANEQPEEIPTK